MKYKAYILIKNSQVQPDAFTALKALCDRYAIPYDSAIRDGKRVWVMPNEDVYMIKELVVIKIKGRGRKSF